MNSINRYLDSLPIGWVATERQAIEMREHEKDEAANLREQIRIYELERAQEQADFDADYAEWLRGQDYSPVFES